MGVLSRAAVRDAVLTIGVFDGVHVGHRHLVQQVVRRAREEGWLGGAVTFHPHPRVVLTGHGPSYLVTVEERLGMLGQLGLDLVEALPFTAEVARLSARDFMGLLCQNLRLRELWVGPDFALGHRREGTVARLAEIGRELGYRVCTVPPLILNGQTVSSTLIRALVEQGEVEAAARLLRRRHHVSGRAMPDERRESHAGPPTARVAVAESLALPARGAYAAQIQAGARKWWTTAEVTACPGETGHRLETRMPDPECDLYGSMLRVEFVRRMQRRPS